MKLDTDFLERTLCNISLSNIQRGYSEQKNNYFQEFLNVKLHLEQKKKTIKPYYK